MVMRIAALVAALALTAAPPAAQAAGLHFKAVSPAAASPTVPLIGAEVEVEIGRSVAAAGHCSLRVSWCLSPCPGKSAGNRVELPAGLYRLVGVSGTGRFFQADPPIKLAAFGISGAWPEAGIYLADDPAQQPELYYLNSLGMVFSTCPFRR